MSYEDKVFYNEASSAKLGWELGWFCAEEFDDVLFENVKSFQRDHNLEADGLVGPITFRRMFTEREAKFELTMGTLKDNLGAQNYIVSAGSRIPVEWEKVVSLHDEQSLALPSSCYRKVLDGERKPHMIVTHWDAALSAKSCKTILEKRNISSHFVIDNDGTIYQMVDTNDIAWHVGKNNKVSIGIDFSNAYYTKYQKYYRKKGFGNRPVLNSKVHGAKLGDHLGYYPVQEKAYKALLKALCTHYKIPLTCPLDKDGKLLSAVSKEAESGKFKGVVSHYHISRRKIDCAGLEIDRLLNEIKTN